MIFSAFLAVPCILLEENVFSSAYELNMLVDAEESKFDLYSEHVI